MSEAVSRAARRDLRRAIGEDGLKLVEAHEGGLAHHADVLKGHLSSLREHERRLDALTKSVADEIGAREALVASVHGFTFRQRLSWLFRGHV